MRDLIRSKGNQRSVIMEPKALNDEWVRATRRGLLSAENGSCDAVYEFKRLFRGRTDAYAVQRADGSYRPIRRPLSNEVLRSHLSGRVTVGLYLVTPIADTCGFMAIDVDHRSKAMASALIAAAGAFGFGDAEFLLESSGNKGFHLWFFFTDQIPAKQAMALGELLCKKAGLFGQVEIFPKQARVRADGFGNLIKLPGRHAKSGRFSRFFSASFELRDVAWLRHIQQISPERVASVLAAQQEPTAPPCKPPPPPRSLRKPIPCIKAMLAGVSEGKRNVAAFRLAIFLRNQGLPQDLTTATLQAWNSRNRPAAPVGELDCAIQQVYLKEYQGYGCRDPQMQEFCDPECCPIHQARQKPGSCPEGPKPL